jgi:nucleotide sugar dehydrogenase
MQGSVCIIGLGHVGLPLAVKIAHSGQRVLGVDLNHDVVSSLQRKKAPFYEAGLDEMLESREVSSHLTFSRDFAEVANYNVIIVTVGTPVAPSGEPILSHLDNCTKSIASSLRRNQLIIYRSTVPPGTLRNRIRPLLEEKSGLKVGRDFYLSYCPERLVEGVALRELTEIPHLVGGLDEESTKLTTEFFSKIGGICLTVSEPEVAEMAKIMDNIYRDVNIALANEFSLVCRALGIDVIESIKAANSSPRTKILIPGCGVGGSCLNKDPYMLLWSIGKNFEFGNVIRSARKVNESMPAEFVEMISDAMGQGDGASRIVSILGISFKSGTDDVRGSVSPPIAKLLHDKGYLIRAYDPHVSTSVSSQLLAVATISQSLEGCVKDSSALVICSDHNEFRNLDLRKMKSLTKSNSLIADGRNIIKPKLASEAGFKYIAIGHNDDSAIKT